MAIRPEDLGVTQRVQLTFYLNLLHDWNKVHNLSASQDPKQLKAKHIHEALCLAELFCHDYRPVYDVGAGAGALGIVIAILHGYLDVHLVEKSAKKCAFLRQCRHELDLFNLTVIEERVQDVEFPERGYQIVTRAFASLERSAELFGNKLNPRSTWLALKGANYRAELERLPPSLRLVKTHALGSIEPKGLDLGVALEIASVDARA